MKKILLSMAAIMATAMTAGAADSFTLVNSHGSEPIANGATLTVTEFDEEYGMGEFEYIATPDAYPATFEIWKEDISLGEVDGNKAFSELCWQSGMQGNCLPEPNVPNELTVTEQPLKGQVHYSLPNDDINAKVKSTIKYFVQLKGKENTKVEFTVVFDNEGSGVGSIIGENAPAEYFTLDGVRVANPGAGLYIVKQGSKVRKTILK